jgi:hypothetical protein
MFMPLSTIFQLFHGSPTISAAVLILVIILAFRFARSEKDLKICTCAVVVESDNALE